MVGVTKPDTVVDTYRVRSRLRRNFYRDWLFYEIEPQLEWRRDEENGGYYPVGAITRRVEVQFGWKSGKPPS